MSVLRGFLWLLSFLVLGDILVTLAGLPVSAGVVGMLLLSIWLMLCGKVPRDLATAAQPLIGVLAMLVMPGVVSIFFMFDELAGYWTAILVALVLGTLLSVFTTLWLMNRLMGEETLGNE
ncbi:CidA/LrgA family protein [Vreelandella titanicae]|jgi:putative effector of murein hydrolase LrgA (UPF0299 family)|uniref:CidA/LrgA family protein n=1 Tax=Vreelandella titanicae TaxID=664683 RepID=A0A558JF39_9GAMM|nr:CidA/LrgA family protein [Halomonas titanicae]TVU92246.1 CidA/LrgA family protein [Halomonas titanicae]|tara:strand:+ start:26072 stop:26431 length:360 start_codon:yes stop_codon:yes gene_type:complete